MAMGRRKDGQPEFWIAAGDLPRSPGHPFYERLGRLLDSAGFDRFAGDLCREHYAEAGRPGIPPERYFRMLFVGYFEGLGSQRGIAWKCADSRSVRTFLGLAEDEAAPDHSSLTNVRKRLPTLVHERVFQFVLKLADEAGLLKGKTLGVDSTTLEADAAMKSLVRRDSGEDYKEYITRLAKDAGIENPTAEERIRFDRTRPDKKMSNGEWKSDTDPDAAVTKMKDGSTHLAYKAEHAVDLETGLVVAATVHRGDAGDADTLADTLLSAAVHMHLAVGDTRVAEAAADKGYHKAETLALLEEMGVRTYIPEKEQRGRRRWVGKPAGHQAAYRANRRRTLGARGRELQRKRSHLVERSFAHMCETGGMRRMWLRGLEKVHKRYLMQAAAHDLGIVMRKLFGVGTPRGLQGLARAFSALFSLPWALLMRWAGVWTRRTTARGRSTTPAGFGNGRQAA